MPRSFFAGVALSCLSALPLAAEPAVYPSPFDAVAAMIEALEARDKTAVLTVFGPESEDFIYTGNPAEDTMHGLTLLELWRQGFSLVPLDGGGFELTMGEDGWPFPIPLERVDNGWAFDVAAGRIEVEARDIGLNELEVIALMEAYVDVQAEFRLTEQDGDGVMEFARRIIATPEHRDGLYWPAPGSPLGELFAAAAADGFNDGDEDRPPIPYLGYIYRILTEQGPDAPGGAFDYLVNDNMVGGHALLAVPDVYGETGVYSFMVAENGIVYQADLGEDTTEIAEGIMAYNPGPDWSVVDVTN